MLRSRRIISFSLWGEDRLYNVGAVQNVQLARRHYPAWICRFYCSEDVPVLPLLWRLNCEVIICSDADGDPLFWRFYAANDPDAEFVVFRDCDSRVNSREAAAVAEWQASGRSLHTMHDQNAHTAAPILAGMWGIRGGQVEFGYDMIARWRDEEHVKRTGPDQDFLHDVVWPLYTHDHIGHAASDLIPGLSHAWGVTSHRPFPPHGDLESGTFVGERIPV